MIVFQRHTQDYQIVAGGGTGFRTWYACRNPLGRHSGGDTHFVETIEEAFKSAEKMIADLNECGDSQKYSGDWKLTYNE